MARNGEACVKGTVPPPTTTQRKTVIIRRDASELLAPGGALERRGIDVVVGLHACGALSDLALAHATARGAAFCVVTCCFASLCALPLPPPHHTQAAWLGVADGGRGGVAESSALVTPDELRELLRAAERQGDPELSQRAAHSANALRARAVQRVWGDDAPTAHVQLLRFEARFSPRNFCLAGAPWQATGLETVGGDGELPAGPPPC